MSRSSDPNPVQRTSYRLKGRWTASALSLALMLIAINFGAAIRVVSPATTHADEAITLAAPPSVQNRFPTELVFSVSARDSAQITDAVLHYQLLPDSTMVQARGAFQKGTSIQAEYHLRSNGNPLYMPPGKQVKFTWTLSDANGASLTTPQTTTSFDDTRFQWQHVTAGNLTLYYYRGSTTQASSLLAVGRLAIDKAAALESVTVDFPLKLYAYTSSQDFLPAAQKESQATDPGIEGQAQPPDTVLFVASSLTGNEVQDTVRHELTHLVTGAAVRGGFENLLPLWLNEGISVYEQSDPDGYGQALQQAVAADTVVPIQVLESSRGIDAGLFYGESWALVKFLVEKSGPQTFAQLLAAIKNGTSIDKALQAGYGFDRTGLYNAWRDSEHLSGQGRSQATSAAGATPGSGEPSNAGQPSVNATPDIGVTPSRGATENDGAIVLLVSVAGALTLALVAAVVALIVVLAHRNKSRSSG